MKQNIKLKGMLHNMLKNLLSYILIFFFNPTKYFITCFYLYLWHYTMIYNEIKLTVLV